MRRFISAALGLLALVVCPVLVRAQALAQRVPDDALLYIAWQGTDKIQPQFQGSHLKAVLDSTTLPQFLRTGLSRIIARLPANGPQRVILRELLATAGSMCKYPTALYFGPLTFGQNGQPVVRMAILCDAGPGAADLQEQVQSILEEVGRTPLPVAVKTYGTVVALTIGNVTADLDVAYSGKSTSALAASKTFQAAAAQVQKDAALTCFVNVAGIVQVVDTAVAHDQQAAGRWAKARDALNLKGFTQIAVTAGFDGKDWLKQSFVGLTGPRTGLTALFRTQALSDEIIKAVPQSAVWFVAGRLDLANIYDQVLAGATLIDPSARDAINEVIAKFNLQSGLDLRADLFGTLGDQWVGYSAPAVSGSGLMGLALVNNLRDGPKLAKSLDGLQKFINEQIPQNTAPGSFEPKIAIQKAALGNVDVHHISLFIVDPAWGVKDNRFYAALLPQTISSVVAQGAAGGKTILDNPAYSAARQRLGVANPMCIEFIDLPRTAPDSYALLGQVAALLGMFGGADAPPTIVPPLHKLLPELSPAISATWSDDAGWHAKQLSPIPGAEILSGQQVGMLGSAAPALFAAIALPALARARVVASNTKDAAQLAAIGKMCMLYANNHDSRMPEHLAELLSGGLAPTGTGANFLVSSGSGTTPVDITPELAQDWKKLAPILDQHCDYLYFGQGVRLTDVPTPAATMLACIKPAVARASNTGNVLFFDGHVEAKPLVDLANMITRTNGFRARLNLDPVGAASAARRLAPARTAPANAP